MKLSAATIDRLPAEVKRFGYDRSAVRRGVVHLGIGAFHRAHQALLFEKALAAGDLRWGITAVSLRSATVRDQMAPQDGLYTVEERRGADTSLQLVGAVQEVLVAPEDPRRVIAAIAAPETHIVTLTITEKGYKLDRAAGGLDAGDPDIVHDRVSANMPRSAPGFLVAGLAARRAAGLAAPTIISCDNLPHNGRMLREAVLALARARDAALADWIAAEVAFPATMVDRIVPATTDADVAALTERIGLEDRAMVKAEPFFQWVIEEKFSGSRPDFAVLGAQLAPDVVPWEKAKLRLLNGAHSAIAYLGGLAGDLFVHQFIARPNARRYIDTLWDELAATLVPPPGLDLASYRAALLDRFANPSLEHRTRQIAMDGSQKLPQRLVVPFVERCDAGLASPAVALAIAAWIRWQRGRTDEGADYPIEDPAASRLAAARTIDDYLAVLGADFSTDALAAVATSLDRLERSGASAALGDMQGDLS